MKQTKENILYSIHKLCRYIPHLALFISISAIVIIYILFGWALLSYALVILIPLILVSLLLIFNPEVLTNRELLNNDVKVTIPLSQSSFIKLYFIVFIIAYTYVLITNARDLVFIITICVLYLIILLQLFSKCFNRYNIYLIELLLTTSLLVFTRLFCYEYYYGGTDIIYHASLVSSLLESGDMSIISTLDTPYEYFNLFHLGSAIVALVTNQSVHHSIYIALVSLVIVAPVFIYYISGYFSKSKTIMALSAFSFAVLPMILGGSTSINPHLLSTMGFVIVLYALISIQKSRNTIYYIIILIATLYITLVHHMQLPILYLMMFLFWAVFWIYFERPVKECIIGLFIFYLIPLIYWIYTYFSLGIYLMYHKILISFMESNTEYVRFGGDYGSIDILSFMGPYLSSSVMVILIMCGIYYILSPINLKHKLVTLGIITLIMFPFFIPGVFDISYILESMLGLTRFRVAMAVFFALIMGVGGVVLIESLNKYIKNIKISVILTIVVFMVFVILSPICYVSSDSSVFDDTPLGSHRYFETKDINTMIFIVQYVPDDITVYSDTPFSRFFENLPSKLVSYNMYDIFFEDVPNSDYTNILFAEKRYYSDAGLKLASTNKGDRTIVVKANSDNHDTFMSNTKYHSIIYDIGTSSYYYKSA